MRGDTVTTPAVYDGIKAANYALRNAGAKSSGNCARYVREALNHGGERLQKLNSAHMQERWLIARGWSVIARFPQPTADIGVALYHTLQSGDVAIFQHDNKRPHGHSQMWHAGFRVWVSDFVQRRVPPWTRERQIWPGPGWEKDRVPFVILTKRRK